MNNTSDRLARERLWSFLSHFVGGAVKQSKSGTSLDWAQTMGLADIGSVGNTFFLTFTDDEGVNRKFRVEFHPTDPKAELTPDDMQKLRLRWKREVVDREQDIDPDQLFDWEGLLLGFLIGAGVPRDQAIAISQGAPGNGWPI